MKHISISPSHISREGSCRVLANYLKAADKFSSIQLTIVSQPKALNLAANYKQILNSLKSNTSIEKLDIFLKNDSHEIVTLLSDLVSSQKCLRHVSIVFGIKIEQVLYTNFFQMIGQSKTLRSLSVNILSDGIAHDRDPITRSLFGSLGKLNLNSLEVESDSVSEGMMRDVTNIVENMPMLKELSLSLYGKLDDLDYFCGD